MCFPLKTVVFEDFLTDGRNEQLIEIWILPEMTARHNDSFQQTTNMVMRFILLLFNGDIYEN